MVKVGNTPFSESENRRLQKPSSRPIIKFDFILRIVCDFVCKCLSMCMRVYASEYTKRAVSVGAVLSKKNISLRKWVGLLTTRTITWLLYYVHHNARESLIVLFCAFTGKSRKKCLEAGLCTNSQPQLRVDLLIWRFFKCRLTYWPVMAFFIRTKGKRIIKFNQYDCTLWEWK